MPLNKYTEKFWYNDDLNRTMRLVVSAPTEHPTVWKVTKIENTKPMGIQKLTLYQNFWDDHKDYIEKDKVMLLVCMQIIMILLLSQQMRKIQL